jgi:hypothetical protein
MSSAKVVAVVEADHVSVRSARQVVSTASWVVFGATTLAPGVSRAIYVTLTVAVSSDAIAVPALGLAAHIKFSLS